VIVTSELYPRKRHKRYTPERDKFLRDNPLVDPAMLADSMGVTERWIIGYQRKLGIRKLTGTPRKNK
jgi:hypothetical protein